MPSMEVSLSSITLGTAQLGMDYGIANTRGMPDVEQCFEILDFAWEHGVTAFDTAGVYGTSEQIIGEWLRKRGVHPVLITKIPSFGKMEFSTPNEVKKFILRNASESLRRLNVSQVWCLMLHSPEMLSKYNDEVYESLSRFKENGGAQHFGISVYRKEEMVNIFSNKLFNIYQAPINIFNMKQYEDPAVMKYFNDPEHFLFARSIYLQGLFFLSPDAAEQKVPGSGGLIAKLQEISDKFSIAIDRIALYFVKQLPFVSSIAIGCETKQQVMNNLALLHDPIIPSGILEDVANTFRLVPENVIAPRKWKRS